MTRQGVHFKENKSTGEIMVKTTLRQVSIILNKYFKIFVQKWHLKMIQAKITIKVGHYYQNIFNMTCHLLSGGVLTLPITGSFQAKKCFQIFTKCAVYDNPAQMQSIVWAYALLSIHTFCKLQWFCKQTVKA